MKKAIWWPVFTNTSIKGQFKALFAQFRLADREPAVARFYRQIEALYLVFKGSQKIELDRC